MGSCALPLFYKMAEVKIDPASRLRSLAIAGASVVDVALTPLALLDSLFSCARSDDLTDSSIMHAFALTLLPSALFGSLLSLFPATKPIFYTEELPLLSQKVYDCCRSQKRSVILITFPLKVVASIVDCVIGIFAAAFSLLALGEWREANQFAPTQLYGAGLPIALSIISLLELLNPHAIENLK